MKNLSELIICIKGAGEMATGTACRLYRTNFKKIFMLEIKKTACSEKKGLFL